MILQRPGARTSAPATYEQRQVRRGVVATWGSIAASLSSLVVFLGAPWTGLAISLGAWIGGSLALAAAGAVTAWFAMDLVWSGRQALYDRAVGAFQLACCCFALLVVIDVLGALYFTRDACCG